MCLCFLLLSKEKQIKVITRPKEERSDLVVIEGKSIFFFFVFFLNKFAGLPENVKRAYEMSIEVIEKAKKEKESDSYRSSRTVAASAPSTSDSSSDFNGRVQKSGGLSSGGGGGGGGPARGKKSGAANGGASDRDWSLSRAPKFAGAQEGGEKKETTEGEVEKKATEPEVKVEVPFPAEKTGVLFGKEGNTVKHIKRKSRVSLQEEQKESFY
jgi:hypothetical protein